MELQQFDEIGGRRFCKPRDSRKHGPERTFFTFLAIGIAITLAMLLSGKWAVVELERGNSLPMRIVGIGFIALFGVLYLSLFVVAFTQRRRDAKQKVPVMPGVPANAIPCQVKLYRHNSLYIAADGWLYSDEDLLCFRGDRFDFELRLQDFPNGPDCDKLSAGSLCRILGPKSFGSFAMAIGKRSGGSDLKPVLDRWRRSALTSRTALYPPFHSNVRPVVLKQVGLARKMVAAMSLSAVIFGGLGLLTHLLFREYLNQPNPWAFAMAFAALPLIFGLMAGMSVLEAKASHKAVEKLKRAGRVEMA